MYALVSLNRNETGTATAAEYKLYYWVCAGILLEISFSFWIIHFKFIYYILTSQFIDFPS